MATAPDTALATSQMERSSKTWGGVCRSGSCKHMRSLADWIWACAARGHKLLWHRAGTLQSSCMPFTCGMRHHRCCQAHGEGLHRRTAVQYLQHKARQDHGDSTRTPPLPSTPFSGHSNTTGSHRNTILLAAGSQAAVSMRFVQDPIAPTPHGTSWTA